MDLSRASAGNVELLSHQVVAAMAKAPLLGAGSLFEDESTCSVCMVPLGRAKIALRMPVT